MTIETVHKIKQGDTKPSLLGTLTGADGAPQLLTSAAVKFSMRSAAGVVVVDKKDCVIVDAAAGTVRYDWAAADTQNPGTFFGEIKVTFPDNSGETFPNDRSFVVRITPRIA